MIKPTFPNDFTVSNGKYSILIEVDPNGLISMGPKNGQDAFIFKHSKPEDIIAIADLFLEAVEFSKSPERKLT